MLVVGFGVKLWKVLGQTIQAMTQEAFNKSVFSGEFLTVMRFKDNAAYANIPQSEQGGIMHIALPIGNGNMLMGTDALESMGQKLTFGNNF